MSLSQALNQFAQNLGRYRDPAPTCGHGHGLRCSANIQVFTGGSLRQPHPSFEIRAVNYQLPANESKPARFPQTP